MLTFNDLIKKGVGEAKYKTIIKPTTEMDDMVRFYNSVWGIVNDTHMAKEDDRYIITGSAVRMKEKFQYFLSSYSWGGYGFVNNSGCYTYYTFSTIMREKGYYGEFSICNGDTCYVYRKKDTNYGECVPCVNNIEGDCCVRCAESIIRQPLSFLGDKDYILETIDGKNDCDTIVEKFNRSNKVKGKDWVCYIDEDEKKIVFMNEKGNILEVKNNEKSK